MKRIFAIALAAVLLSGCTKNSTIKNGNSLFLPAAGWRSGTSVLMAGSSGVYWARTLYSNSPSEARDLYLDSGIFDTGGGSRDDGLSVRPVRAS